MDTLDSLRKKIETTDTKITKLLKERYELVGKIGALKAKKGLPILHKTREKCLLSKLKANHKGSNQFFDYISNIFKNIYKESRKIQRTKQL